MEYRKILAFMERKDPHALDDDCNIRPNSISIWCISALINQLKHTLLKTMIPKAASCIRLKGNPSPLNHSVKVHNQHGPPRRARTLAHNQPHHPPATASPNPSSTQARNAKPRKPQRPPDPLQPPLQPQRTPTTPKIPPTSRSPPPPEPHLLAR